MAKMETPDYQCFLHVFATPLVLYRLIISLLPNIDQLIKNYLIDNQHVSLCSTPFRLQKWDALIEITNKVAGC